MSFVAILFPVWLVCILKLEISEKFDFLSYIVSIAFYSKKV